MGSVNITEELFLRWANAAAGMHSLLKQLGPRGPEDSEWIEAIASGELAIFEMQLYATSLTKP